MAHPIETRGINDTEKQFAHHQIIGGVGISPTAAVSLALPADPPEPARESAGPYPTAKGINMTNTPLTKLVACQELEAHYLKVQDLHLRELFGVRKSTSRRNGPSCIDITI